jgi:acyl carrier protein
MDNREQVRDFLFETLIPTPADRRPADGADLFELGLDSLRVMRLLNFLEERFKTTIPDDEVTPERIGSVDALVTLVEEFRHK